jgi:hypothetical protein
VSHDKLIGHIVQIFADDVRLRTDSQDIVADAFDQCSLPTGRYGAKCVPGVAGDQALSSASKSRGFRMVASISVDGEMIVERRVERRNVAETA